MAAVYIDSGHDLAAVWAVYTKLFPNLEAVIANPVSTISSANRLDSMCHFPAEKPGAPTVRGVPGCDEHAGEGGKQGGGGVAPGGGRNHISGTRIQQQIGAHRCLQVDFPTQNHFNKGCKSFSKFGFSHF